MLLTDKHTNVGKIIPYPHPPQFHEYNLTKTKQTQTELAMGDTLRSSYKAVYVHYPIA